MTTSVYSDVLALQVSVPLLSQIELTVEENIIGQSLKREENEDEESFFEKGCSCPPFENAKGA